MAQQLALLCQMICAAAGNIRIASPMSKQTMDCQSQGPEGAALIQQVAGACVNAIKEALANPSRALDLAKGLGAALTSLQLIQSEVEKGEAGARVITANADTLTRHTLVDVLKIASQPDQAMAALAAVKNVAPLAPSLTTDTPAPAAHVAPATAKSMPFFSTVSQDYINMRVERDSADHPEIGTLILRRRTFLEVIGDRPVDQYFPSDLQAYVNRMQYWPANVTKRREMEGKSILEILESNRDFKFKPMAKKTMTDGFVANIKTMMRYGIPITIIAIRLATPNSAIP